MKVVTPEQMRLLDEKAINVTGIPGIVLMENAALSIVQKTIDMLQGNKGGYVVVLAGKGNNGGDALAVARHLINHGYEVYTAVLCDRDKFKGDALTNLIILDKMGHYVRYINNQEQAIQLEHEIIKADLVIDGIFGTGLKGDVTGFIKWIIQMVNRLAKKILSIDIPSGIDGGNGQICGICIKATETVTFCLPKIGLVINPGCEYVGSLTVADVSIPESLKDGLQTGMELLEKRNASTGIPIRRSDSHKGNYGRLMVITGSKGMTGAGCLAARAAFRSGSGLVYLAVPDSLRPVYQLGVTEAIVLGTPEKEGSMFEGSIEAFKNEIDKMDAILLGPGLSNAPIIQNLVHKVIKMCYCPIIVDADALNVILENTDILSLAKTDLIITPHPGEMARLTGKTISEVQSDRIGIAREFSEKYGITVVLKGSRTVIALPDGSIYINPTGNSSLATAGSGDVLAGIIASFISQKVDLQKAVPASVYLHGLAGEIVSEVKGEHGTIASDVVEAIPEAICRLKDA